jgi:hypothetical protein
MKKGIMLGIRKDTIKKQSASAATIYMAAVLLLMGIIMFTGCKADHCPIMHF